MCGAVGPRERAQGRTDSEGHPPSKAGFGRSRCTLLDSEEACWPILPSEQEAGFRGAGWERPPAVDVQAHGHAEGAVAWWGSSRAPGKQASHSQGPGVKASRRNRAAGTGGGPGARGGPARMTGELSPGQAARLLRIHGRWAWLGTEHPPPTHKCIAGEPSARRVPMAPSAEEA